MEKIKEKTALISIFLKTTFTILKFVMFFFTGSIAIIAEAWHSFTDIVTSLLVYFAIKREKVVSSRINPLKKAISAQKSVLGKIVNTFLKITPEYKASLFIGFFLLFISISLFRKAIVSPALQIQNTFISGVLFLLFSICSYITYKLETRVGVKEKSVALVSDGMHSKADMISSLLVGFSLIIYNKINIDRSVAFIISFFILYLAIDTIINAFMPFFKKEAQPFRNSLLTLLDYVFKKELWKNIVLSFDKKHNLGIRKVKFLGGIFKHFMLIIVMGVSLSYLSTCFYKIDSFQEGIVERFGKPLNYGCSVKPGLHVKFPWPVDRIIKVDSKNIKKINIGNITDKNNIALLWTKRHGTEEPFLSGDNNFFYPYLVIHYKVKNIFNFHYLHKNSSELLENVVFRTISNLFAQKTFYQIVTSYRQQLEINALALIQKELDTLKSGLEVVGFYTKDVHPPISIADSFEDVIAAYQDRKRMINEAIGYKNSSMPKAKGDAEKKIKQAESYVIDKIKHAQGESLRFKEQLSAYKINEEITSRRLYLKCLKEGLQDKRKIVIDSASGVPEVWFDFNKILKLPAEADENKF